MFLFTSSEAEGKKSCVIRMTRVVRPNSAVVRVGKYHRYRGVIKDGILAILWNRKLTYPIDLIIRCYHARFQNPVGPEDAAKQLSPTLMVSTKQPNRHNLPNCSM